MLGGVIFGLSHLYQGDTFMESLGIFGITFMGGIWFAWLFIEWDENLWVPIWMHLLMNFSWELFSISDSALGGYGANVFRVLTIALAIIFTVIYKKKKGRNFAITRRNLWVN